ncbi:MAG: ABC transporter substrate-binding protein [Alphaproteobacteria bacterium]|nr:ABC transporter substrate-binding protein [Alphaproteobacteria bacterium]
MKNALGISRMLRAMTIAAALLAYSATAGIAEQSGKLTVALGSLGFETFLPEEGSIAGHVYWDPVYDYMFYEGEDGKIEPGLIEKWTLADDNVTWTFDVRKGVKFHNGRELDADDIVFNFKSWITSDKSKHNVTTVLTKSVDTVKATGKHQVEVKLKKPQALFIQWLSEAASAIVVPREYGKMSPAEARENPIGTGPWKFVSRSLGEKAVFSAVADHWRKTPAFKELELRAVPEPSTRLAMLKRGEADIIDVPLSFKRELDGQPFDIARAKDAFSAYVFFTGMYQDKKAPAYNPDLPWRKAKVREALNLAVNRQAIADHIFQGEARPAAVPLPLPSHIGYKSSWSPPAYDPAKAKKLLAEAGYPDGFEIELMSFPRPGVPDIPLMIEAIADLWSRIGVTVKIVKTDWGAIRPAVRARKVAYAAPLTQGKSNPDVMAILIGAPFYMFTISPQLNDAVAAVKSAGTADQMSAALGRLGDEMQAANAVVPVALLNQVYATNPKKIGSWPVKAHQGGANGFEFVSKP